MEDTSNATSSPSTCWFCESYPGDEPCAIEFTLVKKGEKSRSMFVPRCKVCANAHLQSIGMGLGGLAGLILGVYVWWKSGFWFALLSFGVCIAFGALLEWLITGRKYKEEKSRITTKPEEEASAYPAIQELIGQGWKIPKEVKREKKDLFRAIKRYEVEKVKKILDKSPELLTEARKGNMSLLQYSLSTGPMASAVYSQQSSLAIIELLVEKGSDLSVLGHRGRTLLHMACDELWLEAAEYFIKTHGFGPNEQDEDCQTPLHYAATHQMRVQPERRSQLVEFLVSSGARINAVDRWNETPLIKAIPHGWLNWEYGVLDTVKVLLALGADVNIKSQLHDGKTAYALLLECEQDEEYKDVLALFEGGKRIGICEVCGRLIFEKEPYYESREWGRAPISDGMLHYDVGRGLYHKRCAEREGIV